VLENAAFKIVTVVPSYVKFVLPAKDPPELYCTLVVAPPGLAAGTAEITEVVVGSTIT
jgi:hypothetical protein